MAVATVTDPLDRDAGATGAHEETVLDRVPGERLAHKRLSGGVYLTRAERMFRCRENLKHRSANDP